MFLEVSFKIWLISLNTGVFPDELKKGEVSSLLKGEDPFIKKNNRPITVLPVVSKVYKRIVKDQAISSMEPVMFIYLCGFCIKHTLFTYETYWKVQGGSWQKWSRRGAAYGPF